MQYFQLQAKISTKPQNFTLAGCKLFAAQQNSICNRVKRTFGSLMSDNFC